MTNRATLRRDRYTCQVCGAQNCDTVAVLTTPTSSPFNDKLPLTLCKQCAASKAGPNLHTPAFKHLMEQGFTVRGGHPYLMAIIRAITNPMQPIPQLTDPAKQILNSIASLQTHIANNKVRAQHRNMESSTYYKALDELKRHGYLHYDPLEPDILTRYDSHATPPLTEDLLPLVNHEQTLRRLRSSSPRVDEPALFLARLYTFAGMKVSGQKLRKFLKGNLPARADYVHALLLHKLLKYGNIVKPAPEHESGWVFTRNVNAYTNMRFFSLLDTFFKRPWHLIMPSDAELAKGARPHFRPYNDPLPPPTRSNAPKATTKAPDAPPNPAQADTPRTTSVSDQPPAPRDQPATL